MLNHCGAKCGISLPSGLSIVTFAHEGRAEREYSLPRQLWNNNILFTNAAIGHGDGHWEHIVKIGHALCAIRNARTPYILICDAKDVAVQSLEGIVERLAMTGLGVLYNATSSRWVDEEIETMRDEEKMGNYKFLNAGVCIGRKDALFDFYGAVYEELRVDRYGDFSEQAYVRKAFDSRQDYVGIDHGRKLFQVVSHSAYYTTRLSFENDAIIIW